MRAALFVAVPALLLVLPASGEDRAPEPAFHRLVRGLHASDRSVRYRAVEALGALGDPAAIPFLIATLEDPDPVLRSMSAGSLFRLTGRTWGDDGAAWRGWWADQGAAVLSRRDRQARQALESLGAADFSVRFDAARALEAHGFREAIPALIAALGGGETTFRWRCARTLSVLSGEDFGLDAARWTGWWAAASKAPEPPAPDLSLPSSFPRPLPEPAPEPAPEPPPVPEPAPPARLALDPHGALEERARLLQEEREALEARVLELERERDRLAASEASARTAMESEIASGREAMARLQRLESAVGEGQARTTRLENELKAAAELLDGALRDRDQARARADQLDAERAQAARELEAARASSPGTPASDGRLEALERRTAGLEQEARGERERADRAEAEAQAVRKRLEALKSQPEAPATADDDLDAWRRRHRTAWTKVKTYVIRREDSLSTIAKRFHTDVDTLVEMNRDNPQAVRDKDHIYAGYKIVVPDDPSP